MKTRNDTRAAVAEYVALLASAEGQLTYEKNVPHVFVPAEIVEGFATDLFHPKDAGFIAAFSEPELKSISRLYGLLCSASDGISAAKANSMTDALKTPEWRSMMGFAKSLTQDLAIAEPGVVPNRSLPPTLNSTSSVRGSEDF
jgi:hypothetical protein